MGLPVLRNCVINRNKNLTLAKYHTDSLNSSVLLSSFSVRNNSLKLKLSETHQASFVYFKIFLSFLEGSLTVINVIK